MSGGIGMQGIVLHLRFGKNFGDRVFDHRNLLPIGYPAVEICRSQALKNGARDTRLWRCQQNRLRAMRLYHDEHLPQVGDGLFLRKAAQERAIAVIQALKE